MIEKPNVRFHDGQILSEEPLNKAMVAVDDCVDAANDAEAKAKTAETAATNAQSSASSAAESSAAIQRALEEIKGSGDIPAATIVKVAEHEAELATLGSEVGGLYNGSCSFIDTIENSFVNANGDVAQLQEYNVDVYRINKAVGYVHIKIRNGSSSYITFYDKNGSKIVGYPGNNNPDINVDDDFPIPSNAAILKIPYAASFGCEITASKNGITNDFCQLYTNLYGILLFKRTIENKFVANDGSKKSLEGFNIDEFDIKNNEDCSIHIKARIGTAANIVFYDINENKIVNYPGNNNPDINVDDDFPIPSNAANVKISYSTEYGLVVTPSKNGDIQELKNTVNQHGKDINSLNTSVFGSLTFSKTIENSFVTNTGEDKYLEGFNTKVYNVISTSDTIHIKARIGVISYITFYDKNGSKIVGYPGNNNPDINVDEYFEIPENAVLLKIPYVSDFGCIVTSGGVIDTVEALLWNKLNGKKIGLLGDSIAAGASSEVVKNQFIEVAASILGATVKNVAIGGWYYGDNENRSIYKQINGVSPSTKSLDGDEDLIVLFAGTNDYGHSFPIGEPFTINSDNTLSPYRAEIRSTCGGLTKTIEELYAKYNGYVPIIICTPLQRSLDGDLSNGGSWGVNNIGKRMEDYIDAIKKVARFFGIPVLDCYDLMNPNIAKQNELFFADGLHPNKNGHRLIGETVASFIKSRCFYFKN